MTERRNQGYLTLKDRTIFEESSSEQYPSHFRERSREKFRQALADLAFTAENFEDEDIAEVFRVLADKDLTETTTYTHESFTQDTVVEALSLFLQGANLVGEGTEYDLENLIEKALKKAYRRTRREQVIGSVDFDLETAPRQEAYNRGIEKTHNDELLTTSERRAMFDASIREIYSPGNEDMTFPENEVILQGPELTQYIIDNLAKIEPGLNQIDFQPDLSNEQPPQPDVFCKDQIGELVLIDITQESLTEDEILDARSLLNEYGGPERARIIVIGPDMSLLDQTQETIESGIEFHELQLGPYGVIKGIENKDS